jgi:hypothetical protein
MRENCTAGSEGGDGDRRFLPLSTGQFQSIAEARRPSVEKREWGGRRWSRRYSEGRPYPYGGRFLV